MVRTIVPPLEANPPLFIDADTVLTFAITFEGFQVIAPQRRQIGQAGGRVKLIQAPLSLRGES